ncbi:MAG: TorF family putative porin, partial [Gammaproteobacteria bacterium]|nr:TorF family putative porin [Gammaproteobacteria bacterium]
MKKLNFFSVSPLALAMSLTSAAAFAPIAAQAETTASGNIGVHSMYLLRGIGRENDNTAVQGGFDYSHDSGFYLGYWGSNLGYSYDKNVGTDPGGNGFENDFYGGYAGAAGDLSYKLGLIQYYYLNVDDSDLTEFLANVGYAGFTLQAQYLLNDGWWGNAGDIYWTLGYSMDLPSNFTLGASLGYYTYND